MIWEEIRCYLYGKAHSEGIFRVHRSWFKSHPYYFRVLLFHYREMFMLLKTKIVSKGCIGVSNFLIKYTWFAFATFTAKTTQEEARLTKGLSELPCFPFCYPCWEFHSYLSLSLSSAACNKKDPPLALPSMFLHRSISRRPQVPATKNSRNNPEIRSRKDRTHQLRVQLLFSPEKLTLRYITSELLLQLFQVCYKSTQLLWISKSK